MKRIFFTLFLLFTTSANAQSEWVIELSTKMPESRAGVWAKGDYIILVSLDSLSAHLRRSQHSLKRSIDYYVDKDSNLLNYFTATANRYSVAATLTENAENGFDLQTLIIYEGVEDSLRNAGNSWIVESYVKQLVELGKAPVFYKGQRIFNLCGISEMSNGGRLESVSDILNQGYEIKTFYDQPDNCIFYEYMHLGW
jgi:hypothetical protein